MNLDDTQLKAVEHAVTSKFAIITGGAGTGKTTIIKEIVERLKADGKTVNMCAFAGKAAARLKEATKQEATTIHRMLGSDGVRFKLQSLQGRCVILDEASMVDSELMAEIIDREPDKLILVGDEAQLPPVGKGQPFHDIIALRPDVVITLKKCYRNSEAVFKAATAIRNGHPVAMHDVSESEKWSVTETGGAEETHQAIIKQVQLGTFFDFEQDIILCPKNGALDQPATVEALNADIAAIVNPRQPHEKFVKGDRVMNTVNLPEKDAWNGTTGTVHGIDSDGAVWVWLDEPIIDWTRSTAQETIYKNDVKFTHAEAKKLKLAYAISVHKSQGSQYRKVVFVCLGRDLSAMLTRPLIYTAVTRTRQQCVVVGERYAFQRGVQALTSKQTIIQELAKAS